MLSRLQFEIDDLVDEMLDRIPVEMFERDDTTFMDPAMGGGQFIAGIIKRLRYNGHNDSNIAGRVCGFERADPYIAVAEYKYGIAGLGTFEACDVLEKDFGDMKFDVIVGNPPYQSGKGEKGGSSAIWRKFVKTSFNTMLSEDGVLSFVCPKLPNSSKDLGHIFTQHQTLWVDTGVSKYFPRVGSSFIAWAVQNTPKCSKTVFVREGLSIDLTNEALPNIISKPSLSILKKIDNIGMLDMLFSESVVHVKLKEVTDTQSPTQSEKYRYKLRRTTGENFHCYTSILPTHYHDNKITFTMSGNPDFTYHDGANDPIGAIKHMSGMLLCKTCNDAENMIRVFESKLSKFYKVLLQNGGMSGYIFLRPNIDYTRSWTDQELYEHFNLTQEEIDLIEETIK